MKYFNILLLLVFAISLLPYLGSLSLVQASGQVTILNSRSLVDQYYTYHVLGEVENIGDAPVSSVTITATGYDVADTIIATSFTLADLKSSSQAKNLLLMSFCFMLPISLLKFTTTV